MSPRTERVARNEVLFRAVNERVADTNRSATAGDLIDFICECGDDSCTEAVSMTLGEYEAVRSDPTHFVLRPGHETRSVENVVARTDRFVVVAKHLTESGAARRTDPRS